MKILERHSWLLSRYFTPKVIEMVQQISCAVTGSNASISVPASRETENRGVPLDCLPSIRTPDLQRTAPVANRYSSIPYRSKKPRIPGTSFKQYSTKTSVQLFLFTSTETSRTNCHL